MCVAYQFGRKYKACFNVYESMNDPYISVQSCTYVIFLSLDMLSIIFFCLGSLPMGLSFLLSAWRLTTQRVNPLARRRQQPVVAWIEHQAEGAWGVLIHLFSPPPCVLPGMLVVCCLLLACALLLFLVRSHDMYKFLVHFIFDNLCSGGPFFTPLFLTIFVLLGFCNSADFDTCL